VRPRYRSVAQGDLGQFGGELVVSAQRSANVEQPYRQRSRYDAGIRKLLVPETMRRR
jgi:hypothetical protein